MIQVLFSQEASAGSLLIKGVTWSRWSHCELVYPVSSKTIGATAFGGVGYGSLPERLKKSTHAALVDFSGDFEEAFKFAEAQLGKPYDWLGAIGLGLHRDWEQDDRWFCSELVCAALKAGGNEIFRAETMRRVTPQHLWSLQQRTLHLK